MVAKGGNTGHEHVLEKYSILAPTLCTIVQEFKEYVGIQIRMSSSVHHTAMGESLLLINAAKIITIIFEQGNPFLKCDMLNLATVAVVPEKLYRDIED